MPGVTKAVAPMSSRERFPRRSVTQVVAILYCLRNFATERGKTLIFSAAICLFVLGVGRSSFAKIHPVPLEKNVDSATCLQCHEEKSKGKSVHTAIQTGCLSCHEVRVNKDVTRVKLITAAPYKLCLTCHTDKDVSQIKGHVHQPAIRDCLTCHDPHASENKNQLLKATSGDKK